MAHHQTSVDGGDEAETGGYDTIFTDGMGLARLGGYNSKENTHTYTLFLASSNRDQMALKCLFGVDDTARDEWTIGVAQAKRRVRSRVRLERYLHY